METKTIPLWWNIEQTPQTHERIVTSWLSKDATSVRSQLKDIINSDGGSYSDYLWLQFQLTPTQIKAQTEYLTPNKSNLTITQNTSKELFATFEQETKWKHEVALKVDGDTDGKKVEANIVEQISTWDASHVKVDLNEIVDSETHIISHNHPDTGALAFSPEDIKSNLALDKQIKTDGYHILQKTYEFEWVRYPSCIVSKLDNTDNKSRCTFMIDDKEFSHLFLCPDGVMRDITDIDPQFAQQILHERLAAIDNN